MRTNVVCMSTVRELLAELDKLRADVLSGQATGWGGSVFYADGREVCYLGGSFHHNAKDRARAMLKVSALRVMREDTPPQPRASSL